MTGSCGFLCTVLTPSLTPRFPIRKMWCVHSGIMSCCLKYPGFCSGVKEGRSEWEMDFQMDWCCFCRDADAVPFCHDEKKLSVKANLLIFRSVYIPSFTCGQQLWPKERDCRYKQQKCVSSKGRRYRGMRSAAI